MVYTVPDSVSDDIAAGANCALSQVMYGLERVDLQLGETVVVQGAGALGLYAVAVAKARGASTVIAVDGVPERLQLATAFGADAVIDITELTAERDRVKRVRSLTDGQGADVVVEVVGYPAAIDEGLKMLAQFGRYVEIGNINMGKTFEFDENEEVQAKDPKTGKLLVKDGKPVMVKRKAPSWAVPSGTPAPAKKELKQGDTKPAEAQAAAKAKTGAASDASLA